MNRGAVLKKRSDEKARAIRTKELRERLAVLGGDPTASTPAEFAAFIKAEIKRSPAVVRETGITAE